MDLPPIKDGEINPVDMFSDIRERLSKLERENAALKAENNAIKAKLVELETHGVRKVIPAPLEPATTIVYAPAPAPVSLDLLPNGTELQALRQICATAYPKWVDDSAEWEHQFFRSLLALSHMRKLDRPDQKRYAHDFVTHAQTVLRSIGKSAELGTPFFMACAVMNVPMSGLGIDGCTISLGLTAFEGVGTAIDPSAWKVTLKAGALPTQHAVNRIVEAPSPVRFYGAQY